MTSSPRLPFLSALVRSIRFRLALWFTAILAVFLLGFSAFVYARQAQDLKNETLARLNVNLRKLENSLKYNAQAYFENTRPLALAGVRDGEYILQEKDILALVDSDGEVVQKVGPIASDDVQQLADAGVKKGIYRNPYSYVVVEAATEGQLVRQNYRFIVMPVSVDHVILGSLILGSPVDPAGQMNRLFFTLVFGNLATLGMALVGGYWLADRAIRPVKTITRTARQIGETDLTRRLNLGTQDELGELAATFDGMLDRLQAAFDRQRQFTADASHELRTPLTIINLEAGRALAGRRTPQEYQRALAVIQSENERMTRLVNNLLTLSRMDAGQAAFDFTRLDLSDVALEGVERLAPLAEQRGVVLSTSRLPELTVLGDRQYLGQVVSNLIENAIKYAPPGGGRVLVETGSGPPGAQPEQFAWVRVEDNGPGIAPEHLPRIFDRFYQVDRARTHNLDDPGGPLPASPPGRRSSRKTKGLTGAPAGMIDESPTGSRVNSPDNDSASSPAVAGQGGSLAPGQPSEPAFSGTVVPGPATAGSGLGLSIVQRIAHIHGGTVSVHSQVGRGSTFTLQLPLIGAPQRKEAMAS